MKPIVNSKDLFRGAFILSIAALVTKLLSALYRVPFQNIVGDIGFYVYQQVYPFYGAALILSTYGFPVVISKLYAEKKQQEDHEGARRLVLISYILLSVIGCILFISLYWGANWIASQMQDENLSILLKTTSFFFLVVPFSAGLRGYFQGKGEMMPTAVSQVGEQLFRVITILAIAVVFAKAGNSLYEIGAGAMFGAVIGGFVGIFILLFFLYRQKELNLWKSHRFFQLSSINETKIIIKALMVQGLAVSISGMLLIMFQLADSLSLYALLNSSGIDSESAKELKGIYDRGQPLIQLGTIVATSISLALVPAISSDKARNNLKFLTDKVTLAFKVSVIIGLGAALGLASIIKPTNIMLFENASGSTVLAILSLLVFLTSVIMTVSSILQGLGNTLFPAGVIIFGFGLKYLLNVIVVPPYGTIGAAVASLLSMSAVSVLLFFKLRKTIQFQLLSRRFIIIIARASLMMVLFLSLYLFLTDTIFAFGSYHRLTASFQAVSASVLGGLIYIMVIIRGNILSMQDITTLPFGSKLLYFMPNENRRR